MAPLPNNDYKSHEVSAVDVTSINDGRANTFNKNVNKEPENTTSSMGPETANQVL